MAELVKLDERLISGKGVLKVPAGAFQDRYYILYLDVVRRPKNEYRSFEWNPPRSVYARLVFRKDGYVQSEDIMRYQREERTYVNDISGQNLRAIKCAYEGILISFDRQNAALGLIPLPYDNLILEYKSLSLGWDEILFQCYADTAIQARFYSLDYDTCNPANDQTDLPPPPPPPLPPVPPGTPIGDISPPYEGEDDGGNTVPFPDDSTPPPPPPDPEPCDKVRVTLTVTRITGATIIITGVGNNPGTLQYAPIDSADILTEPDGTTRARVKGGAQVGTVGCDGTTNYVLNYVTEFNPSQRFVSVEITNIEVVP